MVWIDSIKDVPLSKNEIFGLVFRLTLFGATVFYGVKWMVEATDPTRKQKIEAQKRAERIMKRIGVQNVKLTEYELTIASHLVDPTTINVAWEDIAGLDSLITDLRENVILPIKNSKLFAHSDLIQPPKGILLHGPPGCGKTMIAKATAKEASARFINLDISSLTDKWYGESQKLASSVFTLAVKIQPTIIFIDEIDSFLRARESHDHEATAMMKSQFMSLWDGLITDKSCQVIVMGATNRPNDVDRAILRRMPSMFHVDLPNNLQREAILKLILKNEAVSKEVSLQNIATETDLFSGSDLRELCRNAAIYRVKDYMQTHDDEEDENIILRDISRSDFIAALHKMKNSKIKIFNHTIPLD